MREQEGLTYLAETICVEHLTDPGLTSSVASSVEERECSYCGRQVDEGEAPFAVSMNVVGGIVFDTVTWLFTEGEDGEPEYFGDYYFEAYDTDVVVDTVLAGALDDKVAAKVIADISNAIASPTKWADAQLHDEFLFSWDSFADTVKHRSRFVYIGAEERKGRENEPPARVSQFLEGLDAFVHDDMLSEFAPGDYLYRARMVDDGFGFIERARSDPAKHLGPAPAGKASAGRLNPEGVGLFYGATTAELAVKETALHSQFDDAVVGGFQVKRRLTILDFTKRPSLPSVFDESHRRQYVYATFADDFVERLTQSVRLTGAERVEYVVTQVISEYFRWAPKRRLDGIAWGSHLVDEEEGGKNVLVWASADDVQSDPPAKDDLRASRLWNRSFETPVPTLTLARRDVTAYTAKRSVKALYAGIPGDDDPDPMFMSA
ncbi:RES domain-containing protein [Microbacterium sp. NPDC055665]